MDLNLEFGELIEPQTRGIRPAVSGCERIHFPRSRYKLDNASVDRLKSVMEEVERGWWIGRVLFYDVLIIWVIDEVGDLWFAIEELVLRGLPTGHPRHPNLILREEDADKLGHPSLINCRKGRIGGQIYFDTNNAAPRWIIDPYSGRYGLHPTRTRAHLVNAAKKFSDLGVTLHVDDKYFKRREHA